MYKAELAQNWGMYCNTDKLVDGMMNLLTKYHHDCTEYGVGEIINTYFTNKKHLIELFVKSENYVGNMRICVDVELERGNNKTEIRNFIDTFPENVAAKTVFLKYMDEHGKKLSDYARVGIGGFKAKDLHYGNISERLLTCKDNRDKFRNDGATKESFDNYSKFNRALQTFKGSPNPVLSMETVDDLTQYKINATFVSGMKTSRAFNRFCSYYGVDKLESYNKLFAQYADMVSGLKRKMKFYISLNPLDYLTMSFGNSWSSCHTIDKNNERHMPDSYQGMHCGGTVSYMLDRTSIITYVHNHATDDAEEGKVYRNMFHFNNGTLVQGRIYPQGNDGATDLYKTFRRFMQIELTKLLGLNADEWIKKSGSCDGSVYSCGVHYPDYIHFGSCNISYPKEMPYASDNTIDVGHERICPNCGRYISNSDDSGYLTHENCDDADESWDDDDWS